jgi:hypothetical protein
MTLLIAFLVASALAGLAAADLLADTRRER